MTGQTSPDHPGPQGPAIDPVEVRRLAAYPREGIYIVELAGGRKWAVPGHVYCGLMRVLGKDRDARWTRQPSGRYDTIWMIERLPRPAAAGDQEGEA